MITITSPVPSSTPAELPASGIANSPATVSSFADQFATASKAGPQVGSAITSVIRQDSAASILSVPSPSPSTGAAAPQDSFLQYFLGAAATSAAPEPTAAASTRTSTTVPSPNVYDAPQENPGYTISSSVPYFTPAPDQYVTVTPTNGMAPFQAVSMDSYLQKFIGQSVSDMYGFVSGTQGWANGGATAITDNFIAMVQQRCAIFPSMSAGIDPVAMGTHYANAFMQVLSSVPVSKFGPTSFTGSVLDFLTQGGSAAPTVLNQVPAVLNQPVANA